MLSSTLFRIRVCETSPFLLFLLLLDLNENQTIQTLFCSYLNSVSWSHSKRWLVYLPRVLNPSKHPSLSTKRNAHHQAQQIKVRHAPPYPASPPQLSQRPSLAPAPIGHTPGVLECPPSPDRLALLLICQHFQVPPHMPCLDPKHPTLFAGRKTSSTSSSHAVTAS